jgi:hypothetical protein
LTGLAAAKLPLRAGWMGKVVRILTALTEAGQLHGKVRRGVGAGDAGVEVPR